MFGFRRAANYKLSQRHPAPVIAPANTAEVASRHTVTMKQSHEGLLPKTAYEIAPQRRPTGAVSSGQRPPRKDEKVFLT